jgi:hypothetical protein
MKNKLKYIALYALLAALGMATSAIVTRSETSGVAQDNASKAYADLLATNMPAGLIRFGVVRQPDDTWTVISFVRSTN